MEHKEYLLTLLSEDEVVPAVRADLERLLTVIPELRPMIGFQHCHPHHHLDVWEHTLLALSHAENVPKLRLAILLHDVGKPHCFRQDGDRRHFRGHPAVSATMTEQILTRLGFDPDFTKSVTEIVRRHDTSLTEEELRADLSLSLEILEVQRCDTLAHRPDRNEHRFAYLVRVREMLERIKESKRS